jgi:hypothetical protein
LKLSERVINERVIMDPLALVPIGFVVLYNRRKRTKPSAAPVTYKRA